MKGGLNKAETQAKTFGQKFQAALNPKNLFGGFAAAVAGSQIISFIGDATNAAAEFQDSVSATGVIFGEEAIPALEKWADTAHSAFGASKQDALAAANQIAGMGKMAGLAGDELVGFSQELVQLGGDLASMYGGTTQDAISAVAAALRGEMEPIRRYNVLLDDATLRQKAFEMGLIATTKNALTPQQKVLAAHAAIMSSTTDAQGDFQRTSEGMANSQRDLAAQLENVNIEIGEKMLPVMLDLVNFISDTGIPVMREFLDLLDFDNPESAAGIPVLEEIETLLNDLADAGQGGGILGDLWNFDPAVEQMAQRFGITYEEMMNRISRSAERAGEDVETAKTRMLGSFDAVGDGAMTILPQSIKQATASVGEAAGEMADQIPSAMEEAKAEAEAVARSTPGALANQLRAGIEEYDEALDELTEVAANSVSDLAERQKIEGILASKQLTEALNSDSTRTRLLAADLVADLVSDYELLAPGALDAGQLVNPNLAAGIRGNLGLTRSAANAVVDAARNPLVDLGPQAFGWGSILSANFIAGMRSYIGQIRATSIALGDAAAYGIRLRSPAEAGPLSEPADKWGRKLGEMFAEGMLSTVGGIQHASFAMAGAAVPRLGGITTPGMTGASGAAMSSGDTYILQVDGQQQQFGSGREMVEELERVGRTWG